MPRPWIYLAFFLSGFSGLVNEVVWSRLFVYTMGSSHLSIVVVVSVFMGGLALGSFLGGRAADRARSPLALYGTETALAGLLSAAVLPLLWLLDPVVGWVYRLNEGEPSHPLFTAVKALACGVTILLPATFMGATLPALARHLARGVEDVGRRLGALYAVNTLGAVAGATAAGFVLIPSVGLGGTLALGAGVDVAVGVAVLLACGNRLRDLRDALAALGGSLRGREAERPASLPARPARPGAAPTGAAVEGARTALLAFALSGFVNMCLQLGWTRALIIATGNSTYAFSVILAVFLFGVGVGGWISGLAADRLRHPARALGWVLVGTAAAALATIPWLGLAPARFAHRMGLELGQGGFSFTRFMQAAAFSEVPVILPATLLMGMTFPLAARTWALAAPGLGRSVGAAYAANTLGAILGTALPGFLLLPLLGRAWGLLYLAAGLGFLAGAAVLAAAGRDGRARRMALVGAVGAACLVGAYLTRPHGVLEGGAPGRGADQEARSVLWHPVVFALGSYNSRNLQIAAGYPSYLEYARDQVRRHEPLYYHDGATASVAVIRETSGGDVLLNISGKTEASSGRFTTDTQTQLLSGHLPLLAHRRPESALNVGLGGGVSLGAMVLHPELRELDLVEISPEVTEAARRHFAEANHRALEDPRVRTVIGDGRNHLAHTARRYDVISSEPSNFWIAGLACLFTEEYYRLCLDRLNPGGVMCQWVYTYHIRLEDYRLALRTFLRVFPHVTVWTANYGDTILLGGPDPLVFDAGRLRTGLGHPLVRADLETIGIASPADIFRHFQCSGEALAGWVGAGPTNRDLLPLLEYSSPLGFYDPDAAIHLAVVAATPGPLPPGLLAGFSTAEAAAAGTRREAGRALLRFYGWIYKGDYDGVLREYEGLAKLGDAWASDTAARELAQRSVALGPHRAEAIARARRAWDSRWLSGEADAARDQDRGAALLARARAEAQAGRLPEAVAALDAARREGAPSHQVDHLQGILLGQRGDLVGAESYLRAAVAAVPPELRAEAGEVAYNLGFCLERQGKLEEAAVHYQKAIDLGYDARRAQAALDRCLAGPDRAASSAPPR